ncbi:MAG: DMT family transporter [Pseudomonadota bacterium]
MKLYLAIAAAMLAFAGNSLLARLALATDEIHPAAFTTIRLISGALALLGFVALRRCEDQVTQPNWVAAIALFVYAAAFAFAYIELSAATGALILFATVQVSLIGYGLARGSRMNLAQVCGISLGVMGIAFLMLPGLQQPNGFAAALMALAGISWAVYTLQGGVGDPVVASRDNFLRACALCVVFIFWLAEMGGMSPAGVAYAMVSGVFASAGGYIIWYAVLRDINAIDAATVQLSVPIITALLAVVLLDEPLTMRILVAFCITIGGIALSIRYGVKQE